MLLKKVESDESDEFGVGAVGLVTFLNPYSYLVARKRLDLFYSFDKIYADGVLLVLFLRFLGVKVRRCSFDMTSLAPKVFNDCVECDKGIYFIGGEPGVVELAVERFYKLYPMRVLGFRNGFFHSEDDRRFTLKSILELNPDVVVCGMGSPFQEEFLFELRETGWRGRGYTCGGFLHQTAKKGLLYYPSLINKLNLRWAYRIYDEPKLIKRYLFEYPKFFFCALTDWLLKGVAR